MRQNTRCVLFDLYGTLVDIRTDEEDPAVWQAMAWELSLRGKAWTPDALRIAYDGACRREEARMRKDGPLPEIDILRVWSALADTDTEQAAVIARTFRAMTLRRLRLFPGAKETLEALSRRGIAVCLLSNAQAAFTRPELRLLGIEACFDRLWLSSDLGMKKPAPQLFRLPERDGFKADGCVMVGNDDVCDCGGAAAVGMRSLYIHTEQSPARPDHLPDGCREIPSVGDVPDAI